MAEKFDYADMNDTALELIEEFGMAMSTQRPDGTNRQSFDGVFQNVKHGDVAGALFDGATGFVMTAKDLKRTPADNGDYLIIEKTKWVIVGTEEVAPGGVYVYTKIWVRK